MAIYPKLIYRLHTIPQNSSQHFCSYDMIYLEAASSGDWTEILRVLKCKVSSSVSFYTSICICTGVCIMYILGVICCLEPNSYCKGISRHENSEKQVKWSKFSNSIQLVSQEHFDRQSLPLYFTPFLWDL